MPNDLSPETEESGVGVRELVMDDETGQLVSVMKANFFATHVSGEEVQTTNAKPIEDSLARQTFRNAGALLPPFDPETLCRLLENSSILRPNIDAYVTNIDAFGHRLEPVIDLQADDVNEKIASAMTLERLILAEEAITMRAGLLERPGEGATDVQGLALQPPTPQEVEAQKEQIRVHSLLEEHRITALFESCSFDMSFVTLRRRTRMDLELMGNGYWEVLRNKAGRIAQFSYLYGFTMRLIPLDRDFVEVEQRVRITPLKYENRTIRRRFRRFVQIYENQVVYYKEFGDPRVISSRSGKVFKTVDELKAHDPSDPPATEVMHFKIHSPRSPYGVPRWAGALLPVLGSRQADEINFLYFENKAVPPLAILVSGGRVTANSIKKIEDTIREKIKGKKNFHNILIIEAEPAGGGSGPVENMGRMKIEIKPLTDAMLKDALFMNYGERNTDVVGQNFRLPRLLRGDIRDFNRATAAAAKDLTEEQVFHPEREEFDWEMDQKILGDMGVRYWKFRSNAPSTRDPERLAEIVKEMTDSGILTPEEARLISSDVFNRTLKRIRADWTKQPLALTIAGIPVNEQPATGDGFTTPDTLQDPTAVTDPLGGAPDPAGGAPVVVPDATAAIQGMRALVAGAPVPQAVLPGAQAMLEQMRAAIGKGQKLDGKTLRKMAMGTRKSAPNVLDAETLLGNAIMLMQVREALAAVEEAAVLQKFRKERGEELTTEVIRVANIKDFMEPHGTTPPAPVE